MKTGTKKERIKRHLKNGGSITGLSALKYFGCYRLSSVIHELRNEGMNIKTERIGKEGYARYRHG